MAGGAWCPHGVAAPLTSMNLTFITCFGFTRVHPWHAARTVSKAWQRLMFSACSGTADSRYQEASAWDGTMQTHTWTQDPDLAAAPHTGTLWVLHYDTTFLLHHKCLLMPTVFCNVSCLRSSTETNKKIKTMETAFYESNQLLVKIHGLNLLNPCCCDACRNFFGKSQKGSTKIQHLHVLLRVVLNSKRRRLKSCSHLMEAWQLAARSPLEWG